ncbi:MAG TPA: CHAT domain-containing tetratricopeptide repeat protein, partial [Thermoanaerobaculia bacterium]|nr:CHAT domain-containing tetratricopeptide repeat protein [Thermoanaerobaculia bacterium]
PLDLAAGDFVHATVAQRADIRVELLDPDGKEIVHVDGPNGIREDEEIAAVAERAGRHQLRVLSCPQNAPAADCYTLRLDPPRPATAADRLRAEAVRDTQAAAEAMFEKTEGSWRRQLELRGRLLEIWRTLGERQREAEELVEIGIVHRLLRELEPAARRLHEAAVIYAGIGSPDGEARALNEAGSTCQEAGHLEEAIADYRRALERAGQGKDRKQRGDILNNLGLLLSEAGQGQEGVNWLQQALEIARERKDQAAQANILGNLGLTYERLFERQKALEHYQQALSLASSAPVTVQVAIHNNLGSFQEDLGDWDAALEQYTRSLALHESLGDKRRMAGTLNNLGILHSRMGRHEPSRESFEKALALARDTDDLKVRVYAAHNLGVLHRKTGRLAEAIASWRQVESLAAGHPEHEQVARFARASVQLAEGRLDEAGATLKEGLDRSRERGDRTWEAYQEIALSEVERKRGNLTSALLHAEAGVDIIESLRGRVVDPDLRALFLASNQSYYERQIDILMELHRQRTGEGFDARAVRVSEQARARGLLDLLGEAGADIRQGVDPALLARERQAREMVGHLDQEHMDLALQGAAPARIEEAEKRRAEAVDAYNRIESEVRARSRAYEALTQPSPLDHVEIQSQVLGERTLLLEYALGEEHSYLWAITPDDLRSFVLPPRREIERVARELYDALTARNEISDRAAVAAADSRAEAAGRQLSDIILGPVESLLGDNVLLVVPDGVLQYVPFAALPRPSAPGAPGSAASSPVSSPAGERIIARNQVVSLPSASTLAVLRSQIAGRPPAPKTLAVLADPVFPGDPRIGQAVKALAVPKHRGLPPRGTGRAGQIQLAPLPFSGEEAAWILALVEDPGQKLAALGFDASYARAVSGDLAQYRIVHFATHGLIDNEQPELSKLALSQFDEKGRPREQSFLRLADIYNLELNADLVVLSACQTALGQEVRREGLIGLTRGFMYAGAARVLASLWSVDDSATAKLMRTFYKHLLVHGRSAPDALRRAQLEMADNPKYSSPYYWAGFSLQGEWK